MFILSGENETSCLLRLKSSRDFDFNNPFFLLSVDFTDFEPLEDDRSSFGNFFARWEPKFRNSDNYWTVLVSNTCRIRNTGHLCPSKSLEGNNQTNKVWERWLYPEIPLKSRLHSSIMASMATMVPTATLSHLS